MAYLLFWSWIFIFSIIRPGFALPISSNYDIVAKRALEAASPLEFSQDTQRRTEFIAVAITAAVILVAVIAAIILTILKKRKKKVVELEAGLVQPVDKPAWFIVEQENVQWWRNFRWRSSAAEDPELPEGSRVERIKAALSRKKEKPFLPLYNDSKSLPTLPEVIVPPPKPRPQYPDILERGYNPPLYQPPQQLPAQPTPTLIRTTYGRNRPQPRSPPKAVVTQGLSRSLIRGERRRFSAGRRKSRLSRAALRHPFLPLKDTDAPLLSAPARIVGAAVSKTRLINRPLPLRPIAESPSKPATRPPPLDLDEEPRLEVRFGSPRVRLVSPAF